MREPQLTKKPNNLRIIKHSIKFPPKKKNTKKTQEETSICVRTV